MTSGGVRPEQRWLAVDYVPISEVSHDCLRLQGYERGSGGILKA
jgi:hypothetical protein